MKMNLPQYGLTIISLKEYETNIVLKEFDILCFTSICCATETGGTPPATGANN